MPHVTQAEDHVGAGSFGEVRRPVHTTNKLNGSSQNKGARHCHEVFGVTTHCRFGIPKMGGGVDDFFLMSILKWFKEKSERMFDVWGTSPLIHMCGRIPEKHQFQVTNMFDEILCACYNTDLLRCILPQEETHYGRRQFWPQKNLGLKLGGVVSNFPAQVCKLHWANDWILWTWVCREIWYSRSLWISFMEASPLGAWNPPNQIHELSALMIRVDERWMIPNHLVSCGCFFNIKIYKDCWFFHEGNDFISRWFCGQWFSDVPRCLTQRIK